ncbi:hypothetical protein IEQ34_016828 [Dendrobium chrysotoxum]|uniref:Uncharacterized protein n=1 Tax=Dendrobium chrysotoxum TaxID=161865 RepID=A0AAV7FZ88_DENCH|nr:hypothetical protein IEQ34_016828 [Dendrobium chrysotoxum]
MEGVELSRRDRIMPVNPKIQNQPKSDSGHPLACSDPALAPTAIPCAHIGTPTRSRILTRDSPHVLAASPAGPALAPFAHTRSCPHPLAPGCIAASESLAIRITIGFTVGSCILADPFSVVLEVPEFFGGKIVPMV